jgi:hypothetical protein
METLIRDLRFAVRTMARKPAFTSMAIIIIALGIGANTAIFSLVRAVILRPLPFNDPIDGDGMGGRVLRKLSKEYTGASELYGLEKPQ